MEQNHTLDSNRYNRQASIIPRSKIEECNPTIIGVGAIGRNVAIQMAAIGAPRLHLIDFDTVEETNVVTQGFFQEDIGKKKVEATADFCKRINPEIKVTTKDGRWSRIGVHGNVIFCCVDNMDVRKKIWDTIGMSSELFIDGRMSAESLRVLAADTPENKEYYPSTLFTQEEAYEGSCTARSTTFCANIAAGFLVSNFAKWLRGFMLEPDVMLNLLAPQITYMKDEKDK